ncbi:fasciclin domain-containing protein [Olleya sp. UBA1516]|uniref:fasciclin domain-containing protein n=2 Tax=Olleya TaxID=336276 RepID=UPI0025EDEA5A|nr:fasciclin domain-containing protein [Olleya sp. UBA1516]|tara:strand:+ start:4796 stop:5395 length:600 start_codon:yes stop_codon:yes gene_type:complete
MKTKNVLMAFTVVGLIGLNSCKEAPKNVENQSKEMALNTTDSSPIAVQTQDNDNIVGVAVGNENFTTLVAAVKAADLVETLSGKGPFTVFAPTNDAFNKLPEGTVEILLKPENKKMLTAVLTYHVVAGKFNASAVVEAIKANNGKFTVATVQGGSLTASLEDGDVVLMDEKGNTSKVIMADVAASNGVIHAIDAVVMPK